jgi:hypothetical protein
MRYNRVILGFLFLVLTFCINCTKHPDFPELNGPYLGQKPPGITPEVFAPEIISDRMWVQFRCGH